MKDFKLYTKFNFAKCVHLSLIAVPEGNLCSSPEGISDFIKPYLQELQDNTIIPDCLTLVSIQTIENEEAGVHILTFAKNSTEQFDDDDTASITCFEYLAKILKDDAIDTWTLREQEEINKLDLTQGLHIFLYDIYTGIISHCQTNKPTNQEPIYESEHIIILDSDSTIGCQE